MSRLSTILIVGAIALASSVTAYASPHGQEHAQVSKMQSPNSYATVSYVAIEAPSLSVMMVEDFEFTAPLLSYHLYCMHSEAPVLPADISYTYVRYKSPVYKSPYIKRPDAFYARSSC